MFSTYYDYGRATSPPGSYPAPSSGDPIALDKVTTPASNSTTTSYSWTHTPVGTPTFAVVVIAQNASSTDNITGVTYGGTSMTRVPTDGFASDTAGEPGAVYAYTLASPASGAKTVEVTKSTGTVYTVAASYTLTGTTPSLIDTNSRNEEDTTLYAALSNPSGLSAMGIAVGFTGHGDYATEMTEEGTTTVDMNDDPGSQVMFSGHSDVSTATSITVGWSQSYNDAASIQLLVAASAGSGPSPSSFAFDKVTTPAANTTTTVYSWTHTPVGTPDYVVVAVGVNGNSGADSISGVTYGGVSMTRVPTHGFAQDTSEEVGSVYLYTLASPSSGAQTVAVTKTGATIYALGASYTFAGADGTPSIAAADHENEQGTTPYSSYDAAGDTGIAIGVLFSGHGSTTSIVDYGDTIRDAATVYGSQLIAFGHTPDTTSATSVGWTQTTNDLAWSSVFITDPGA